MQARLLLSATLALSVATPLAAQSPIQLALFNPIQIVKQDKAVKGLRFDLIYGVNSMVTGLDLGLVNMSTGTGHNAGIQFGGVSMVKGSFTGWQSNLFSSTEGRFVGLQTGLISMSHESQGLQWSGVNSAWNHHGLQLAVVNYARQINGVQIGLVNIIKTGGQFPVFPIVNWGKSSK